MSTLSPPAIAKQTPTETNQLPGDEELAHLAAILARRFIRCRDLYARQTTTGYVCVRTPLHRGHLLRHLRGTLTLGAYVLDRDSRARYLVLDEEMDCTGYVEASRRGGYLWLFFSESLPGRTVRRFGRGLLDYFGTREVELFPKQDELTTGPGSLIRLPFGVHRKSGRRYGICTPDGAPLAARLRGQIQELAEVETVPEAVFQRFVGAGETEQARKFLPPSPPVRKRERRAGTPVWEQIKEAVTVRQFVLRYVELSPNGMGLCPFHDDTVPSFSVSDDANAWYCFACDIGGSVIDVWLHWQGRDFPAAVTELSEMLLAPDGGRLQSRGGGDGAEDEIGA